MYDLKTKLDQRFKESDEYMVKTEFEYCLKLMKGSNIHAFEKVVKTFRNWRTESLNISISIEQWLYRGG